MNPTPSRQIGNPAKITRRVFCIHYRACLDHAVKMKWDGFTCGSCGEYQEEDTTGAAHWQRQAECCGKLLKAIFIDRPKKGPGDYRPRPMPPMTQEELVEIWREHHPDSPVPPRLGRWRGL